MTTPLDLPAAGSPRGTRLVVGVDGSAGGASALEWALRQAVLTGASVDAIACWQIPTMNGAGGFGVYVDWSTYDLAGATTEVLAKGLVEAVGKVPGADDVSVRSRVVQGYPTRILLQAAEQADLLVLGSRGHGELSGMLLGSVSLHCVTHAHCPVLVVPAPKHEDAA